MAHLLIVRHGEPTLHGVFLGTLDPVLSDKGRMQAQALAASIGEGLAVYASPLRRAAETAAFLGQPVTSIEEFREISYGPWEGLRWAEIEERFPQEARRKIDDWFGYTVEGAETWPHFRARVQFGLRRVQPSSVVVAHLGVNSVLRELITGQPAMNFIQDYCEIVELTL